MKDEVNNLTNLDTTDNSTIQTFKFSRHLDTDDVNHDYKIPVDKLFLMTFSTESMEKK